MNFKIIAEYDRYYLAESPYGYKECFNKNSFRPNEDGNIIKKKENNYIGNPIGLPPEKVNKSFNKNRKE